MIKALIVDDEKKAREILLYLIEQYLPQVEQVETAGSGEEAIALLRNFHPDIVFLDVEMPQMSGFDLLKAIGEWDFDIIFTTAFDRYAIQAIRFSALDYLLKPIDPDELRRAVERRRERKEKRTNSPDLYRNLMHNLGAANEQEFRLAVATTDGTYFYNTRDIVRCEADRNYTQFFLSGNRRFVSSRTLKEYEEILSDHRFLRVHKSHLVNLDFVEDYLGKDFIVLKDQTKIEVARRRKEAVMEALRRK